MTKDVTSFLNVKMLNIQMATGLLQQKIRFTGNFHTKFEDGRISIFNLLKVKLNLICGVCYLLLDLSHCLSVSHK